MPLTILDSAVSLVSSCLLLRLVQGARSSGLAVPSAILDRWAGRRRGDRIVG